MKWYTKYLAIYDKPVDNVSQKIKDEIKSKLKQLKSNTPVASVVLIAHNEENRILACLWSLCDNIHHLPVEIIVIDNNSTDHTQEVLDSVGATWYSEPLKGPGHARQCGLDHAKGMYYLCIDSDTLYPPYYIATMIRALKRKGIACAYALWSFFPDDNHSKAGLLIYEWLRDSHLKIQQINRPELCVRGMAFAFNSELGKKVGFRTDIIRGEDGSLALGLKKYGKLTFITGRKARVMTGYGTISADGTLFDSFKVRALKSFKRLGSYFTRRNKYEDEESNLIK